MTKKTLLFTTIISFFFFNSCSEDDSDNQNLLNNNNYFPLVVNNSWDYQNTVTAPDQSDIVNQETLTISNSSQVDANNTFEFQTNNPENSAPTTLALSNGFLYKEGNSLIYSGAFGLGLSEFPNLNFEILDGVIYTKNASADEVLFSVSNSIQESIEGFSITIDYTISSIMGSRFENLEVNGATYEDVISSKLVVNMTIPSDFGIDILENQDVVVVTNYFAKDVGLVKSETDSNFDFISFPSVPLEDFSFFTLQELQSFDVTLE